MVRLREFGSEMLKRGGIEVAYLVDDVPYNREQLNLHPQARVLFTPRPRKLSQFGARRELLREFRPDFVHVLNPFVKAYLTLAPTRWNVVGDWDEWPARRPLPFRRHLLEMFLDRWLRNRAALRVVASRYLQQQFRQRFGQDSVYIPYAAYLQQQDDGTSPFAQPTVVYMGNLFSAYDHDLIFEAARLLKDRGARPAITVMGDGPDIEKWRTFVREHGLDNVSVAGFVTGDDLWRRLRHAHVLLFPIRENILNLCRCPSKTFAYAQARRPVVTNRVGEIPAVLGDNAEYIEPTAEAYADAIERAMRTVPQPDVDYGVEKHNWSARTADLLAALPSPTPREGRGQG
jgi:glycosyltransferase involved in cell wall biosynthesis